MSLARRYALTTAKWVFLAMLIHALMGGGSFRGMELESRVAEGAVFALAAAAYAGLIAGAFGLVRSWIQARRGA